MRKKPNAQNTKLKIRAPSATAPISDASGIWPITPVSTTPSKGVERLEIMIGTAIARMERWVIASRAVGEFGVLISDQN
jgi:hypothetical protein